MHILIVVDNPASPHLGELGPLADYSANHLVRVTVQPENLGASQARNAGMAQSFGDWTVLVRGGGRGRAALLVASCWAATAADGGITAFSSSVSEMSLSFLVSTVFQITNQLPRRAQPPQLDDDVVPSPSLLDAYLGAALRRPSARVLVGLTQLPPPAGLLQEALVSHKSLCRIPCVV